MSAPGIYYSNPYNSQSIGKAVNDFCRIIPNDNDWIVLQDGDICYLTPEWGKIIEKALDMAGNQYQILGAYTNRLRLTHQLHNGEFCDDHEMRYHYHIAKQYEAKEDGITKTELPIAGCWMAFRKSTWKSLGGFFENTIAFDVDFCNRALKERMSLGLVNRLYVYHLYRIWSAIPAYDVGHLPK